MKIDMHIHTKYSYDSDLEPKIIVKLAKIRGLNGVAITDHNTLEGIEKMKKLKFDFLLVQGCEIKTTSGEILAYGIQEEIEKELSFEETLDRVHEQGGIAIAPHPFDIFRRNFGENLKEGIDGVEIFNARCTFDQFNRLAFLEAKKRKLAFTAGSDAHLASEIGNAYTIFNSNVSEEDEILKLIRKRECKVSGRRSIPLVHLKSELTKWRKKIKKLFYFKV